MSGRLEEWEKGGVVPYFEADSAAAETSGILLKTVKETERVLGLCETELSCEGEGDGLEWKEGTGS